MTRLIAVTLAAWLLPACTVEQILVGQIYSISTPAAGDCPRLQWQFVVGPQRAISGVLSRDHQQGIATLSGVLDPDDSFRISVTDAAGNRVAQVTGQFTSGVSTISIHGDAAGIACDNQTFELRLGAYFSHQGGGGGGGG